MESPRPEAIVFQSNGERPTVATNIFKFVQQAQKNRGAPGQLPGGTFLHHDGPVQWLFTNMTGMQVLGATHSRTVVAGLNTCAAVFYFSTYPKSFPGVWCHHANAGDVSVSDVAQALDNLHTPAETVWVVFAHERPADASYYKSLQNMIDMGIPANQIVWVPSMMHTSLGVDNTGFLGN